MHLALQWALKVELADAAGKQRGLVTALSRRQRLRTSG